jgi:NAD-dependent dihydropyrimidine dehydrogenase PreA subunit
MVTVKVDHTKCNGDAICISICPVNVFELKDKKAIPVREKDCFFCMTCIALCPEQAIEVVDENTRIFVEELKGKLG